MKERDEGRVKRGFNGDMEDELHPLKNDINHPEKKRDHP